MRSEFIVSLSRPLAALAAVPPRPDGSVGIDPAIRSGTEIERGLDPDDSPGLTVPIRPIAADAGWANFNDELALASTDAPRPDAPERAA